MAQRAFPNVFVDNNTHEQYRVIKKLQKGETGAVFQVSGPLGHQVVKAWYPEFLDMYNTDNRVKASLLPQRILPALATFQHQEFLCQLAPLCTKKSLSDVLKSNRNDKLTEDEARGIFAQVVIVLAQMHTNNMVHGRLQPSNVLLRGDDAIMLNDFGLAQQCTSDTCLSDRWGTLAYMPPERHTPPYRYGKPADAWAFGVMVYRTLIGKLPKVDKKTHHAVLKGEMINLSKETQHLLQALLSPDPNQRPTFRQVIQDKAMNLRGQLSGKKRSDNKQDQDEGAKPKRRKNKKAAKAAAAAPPTNPSATSSSTEEPVESLAAPAVQAESSARTANQA